jgi:type I restriction enzyme S subunit
MSKTKPTRSPAQPVATDLPEGWITTTIGDVAVPKVEQGGPVGRQEFTYIDISSIDNDLKAITEPKKVETKDAPSRARQNTRAYDVLVSMTRPNLNAVAIIGPEFNGAIASTGFDILRANGIAPEWLFLIVRSQPFVDAMTELVQGVLYPAVRPRDVRDFAIPVPPLAEQNRIVAKVEELLARGNAARERLAKVPALLKRFRQSVLAAACSGQLTKNVHDGSLPPDWKMARLDSLFEIRTGGTPDRKRAEYFGGSIPWVRTTEVQNCEIFDTAEKITKSGLENSSAKLFPPSTLLIALYGEGKTRGQVARLKIAAATNQACSALVNPKMPEVTNHYVFWCLRRDYDNLREQSAGGNQPNLSNGLVKAWEIPLPPLDDQREIVHRIEALFALADRIEARVQAAVARVGKITQSILAKAFRGELVPTEAELARQEGRDYEPASVLLERIRASRQADDTQPTPRRRRQPAAEQRRDESASADGAEDQNETARPVSIDQTDRDDVMAVIRDVFSTDGPRTRDQAIHDIAATLGYKRVGSRIAEALDNDIRTAVRRGILENTPDGLRLGCRAITEYTRDFLIEQLTAGMGGQWWEREGLIFGTARWLGFRRTGPVIRETLRSAINGAIRRGILESDGPRLRKA